MCMYMITHSNVLLVMRIMYKTIHSLSVYVCVREDCRDKKKFQNRSQKSSFSMNYAKEKDSDLEEEGIRDVCGFGIGVFPPLPPPPPIFALHLLLIRSSFRSLRLNWWRIFFRTHFFGRGGRKKGTGNKSNLALPPFCGWCDGGRNEGGNVLFSWLDSPPPSPNLFKRAKQGGGDFWAMAEKTQDLNLRFKFWKWCEFGTGPGIALTDGLKEAFWWLACVTAADLENEKILQLVKEWNCDLKSGDSIFSERQLLLNRSVFLPYTKTDINPASNAGIWGGSRTFE